MVAAATLLSTPAARSFTNAATAFVSSTKRDCAAIRESALVEKSSGASLRAGAGGNGVMVGTVI
jgi:hypothetical protein